MLLLENLEPRCLLSVIFETQEIFFSDTPVGYSSSEKNVVLTNIGSEQINITELSLGGVDTDSFALPMLYNAIPTPPSGFVLDEAIELEIGETYMDGVWDGLPENYSLFGFPAYADWFYFESEAGKRIDIETKDSGMQIYDVEIFDPYGNQIGSGRDYYQQDFWEYIDAFYTLVPGRYYLHVDGYILGEGNYQIALESTEDVGALLPDPLTAPSQTNQTVAFTDTLAPKIKVRQDWMHDTDYIQFTAEPGEDIFGSKYQIAISADNPLDLEIYDNQGMLIDTYEYLTPNEMDTFEFTYFGEDNFTVVAQSWFIDQQPNPGLTEFALEVTRIGAFTEVDPQESVSIPVYFIPERGGDLEAYLVVETDADGGTKDKIALYGTGIGGDLFVFDMQFPDFDTYPDDIQSGGPLTIKSQIFNFGPGHILEDTNLRYYLSQDSFWDYQDTLLQTASGQDTFEISAPFYKYMIADSTATLEIPPVENDTYYIIAVVDEDNLVSESNENNNIYVSLGIYMDPYNTVINDSVGDPSDRLVDFGKVALQRTFPEQYVTIAQRYDVDVNISNWYLENGTDFELLKINLPNNTNDDILLNNENHSERIYIRFTPQTFDPDGSPVITDTLYITTNETQYAITLQGTVTGADLIVEEDSGRPNDDKLELGTVNLSDPGNPQTSTYFALTNNGDQVLYIQPNGISLEQGSNSPFSLYVPSYLYSNPLYPGQSGYVMVYFQPEREGEFFDTINIVSNDPNDHYTYPVEVHGIGLETALKITENFALDGKDDNILNFGWQPFDSTNETTVTYETSIVITNKVNYSLAEKAGFPLESWLTITGWEFGQGSNGFTTVQTNDPWNADDDILVPPGTEITLGIQFFAAPALANGNPVFFTDTLTIYSENGSAKTINMNAYADWPNVEIRNSDGSLNAQQYLSLDTVSLEHNQTDMSNSAWFFIRNGKVRTTLSNINIAGEGFSISAAGVEPSQDGSLNFSNLELNPAQNLRINVTFVATGLYPGNYNGELEINGSMPEPVSMDLTASIVSPEMFLSDMYLSFNSVNIGTRSVLPITIHNNWGTSELVIYDWSTGNSQFFLDLDDELTIPPGESIDLAVTYRPTQIGESITELNLYTNDPDDFETTVILTGQSEGRPIPIDNNKPYSFRDAEGNRVYVMISQGEAEMYLEDGKRDRADIAVLALSGTTASSRLTIFSTGQTHIGSIRTTDFGSGTSSLGSIIAPKAVIENEIDISGSLYTLLLGDIIPSDSQLGVSIIVDNPRTFPINIFAGQIGDNVDITLTGDLVNFQAKSFSSGLLQANSINQVNITKGDLGASILSVGDIRGINNFQGTFSGTIRAENLTSLNVKNLDDALISVANKVGRVFVRNDIDDSYLLAGYDIGMDGLPGAGDALVKGSIDMLYFGGEFRSSYVAIGVMTDPIYSSLGLGLSGTLSSGTRINSAILGGRISVQQGEPEFGFYFDGRIGSRLSTNLRDTNPYDSFVIDNLR